MYVTSRMMAVPRERMRRPCRAASSPGILGAEGELPLRSEVRATEVEPSVLEKWSILLAMPVYRARDADHRCNDESHGWTARTSGGETGRAGNVQAAGRMSVMQARVMRDELACAAVIWKVAS